MTANKVREVLHHPRWAIEASNSSDGTGRVWEVGAYCLDLSWPWWSPWRPEDIWPDGNRPNWRKENDAERTAAPVSEVWRNGDLPL